MAFITVAMNAVCLTTVREGMQLGPLNPNQYETVRAMASWPHT